MFTFDFDNVFNLFFPKRCPLCKENILINEILCGHCASLCHAFHAPTYLYQNYSIGALFYYEFAIKELILNSKFRFQSLSLEILKKIIIKNLLSNPELKIYLGYKPSTITYIPTHWRSRLFRGFDLPEIFAYTLGQFFRVPTVSLLSLKKFKKRQSSIKRKSERMSAVKKSFILKHRRCYFEDLLIVDDITTTGATLKEAIITLKPIASNIKALAMAKTP